MRTVLVKVITFTKLSLMDGHTRQGGMVACEERCYLANNYDNYYLLKIAKKGYFFCENVLTFKRLSFILYSRGEGNHLK